MRNATISLIIERVPTVLARLCGYDEINSADFEGRLVVTARRDGGTERVLSFAPGHWSFVDINGNNDADVIVVPVAAAREAVAALTALVDDEPFRYRDEFRAAMLAFAAAMSAEPAAAGS